MYYCYLDIAQIGNNERVEEKQSCRHQGMLTSPKFGLLRALPH